MQTTTQQQILYYQEISNSSTVWDLYLTAQKLNLIHLTSTTLGHPYAAAIDEALSQRTYNKNKQKNQNLPAQPTLITPKLLKDLPKIQ